MKIQIRIAYNGRPRLSLVLGTIITLFLAAPAWALDRVWIGSNLDWLDNGSTANWNPADEPDPDDTAIFNTANNVALGSANLISSLFISNNFDLLTSGYQLVVTNQSTIDGAGSTLRVDPHTIPATTSFQTLNLDLNNGGGLTMAGGIATVTAELEVNAGSVLGGHGTVNVGNFDLAASQAFENSGLVQPQGNTAAPQTLTIHANGLDTIDLDGDSELGIVDVDNALANVNADTVTLVIDGPLDDPAGGTLQIGQRDTLTFTKDFALSGASLAMTGGNNIATLNGAGKITSITSSTFAISGAATIANDMTFGGTANAVTIGANSSLTLDGTVAIPDASMLVLNSSSSQLIVSGATTITEATGDFNWDGPGIASTTVQGTGQLSLTVGRVDTTDDLYGGTLNLNDDGDVFVNNTNNVWTMGGTLNKNNAGTSTVSGDAVNVTGSVTVNAGTLSLPTTTLASTATVLVNGVMSLGGASVLAGPASLTGSGTFRLLGTSIVSNNTTVNVNSFDWDGAGSGTLHTINDGVVFTINSPLFDQDDAGDMDDPINLGGAGGILAVNGPASWIMRRTLTANTSVLGICSLNGSSRMILDGASAILNANGQTAVNAPLTFGTDSTVNIAAAGFVRLNGGDTGNNANQITGSTINGPGGLVAINNSVLRGFGTINAPITFQNSSALQAAGGTLTINGTINQVATIGTYDTGGILNVVNAWNANVAAQVVLNGGELQGGTITVADANGIKGKGLVTSRVINNTRLEANQPGGTLVFQTAANDNDWDGASNIGLLAASNGGTLEVRDNSTFSFGGTVSANSGGQVYANGFGLNFPSGSTINLNAGTLLTSESTDLRGAINTSPGAASTIGVQFNRFLTFRSTSVSTLEGDLRLTNNNIIIEAGAAFSGNGAVIVPKNCHVILEANASMDTLLNIGGTLRPAGYNTIGRVDVRDYQQDATGSLEVELTGANLNQYDRVVVDGIAQLDGEIVMDIDGGFVPAIGNTFNIIGTSFGVAGHFTSGYANGMPLGLTFQVKYFPTIVQLAIVAGGPYETWISLFPSLTTANDRLKNADPDGDGFKNLAEFAFDDDPTTPGLGKIVPKIAPVGGSNVLTVTFPARVVPGIVPEDPPGNDFVITNAEVGFIYTVQASDEVGDFAGHPLNVTEVTGAAAAAIQANLPPLHNFWVYRTFRCPKSIVGNPADYIRVTVSN